MFLQNIHIHLSQYKYHAHKTTIEFAFFFANLMICKDSSYLFLLISLILDIFCQFSLFLLCLFRHGYSLKLYEILGCQGSEYEACCLLECGTIQLGRCQCCGGTSGSGWALFCPEVKAEISSQLLAHNYHTAWCHIPETGTFLIIINLDFSYLNLQVKNQTCVEVQVIKM